MPKIIQPIDWRGELNTFSSHPVGSLERTIVLTLVVLLCPLICNRWPAADWIAYLAYISIIFSPIYFLRRRAEASIDSLTFVGMAFSFAIFSFSWALAKSFGSGELVAILLAFGSNAILMSLLFGSRRDLSFSEAGWDRGEFYTVAATLVIILLMMGGQFRHFGEQHGGSTGYPYLVVTDFFHHMAVVSELQKAVPPVNPYYSPEVLHYYWLAHVIPATFSKLRVTDTATAVQMTCIVYALLTTALFASTLRSFLKTKVIWIATFGISFFFYTFAWIIDFLKSHSNWLMENIPFIPWDRFLIEGGEDYSGLSHGFFRDFVTEPHGTLATALILAFFAWHRYGVRIPTAVQTFVEGILLGACFGIDGFLGLTCTLWWGLVRLWDAREQHWSWDSFGYRAASTLLGLILVHLLFFKLQIQGSGSGNITLEPYWRMLLLFPVLIIIEFGPVGILGVLGLRTMIVNRRNYRDVHLFALAVFPTMFFIKHRFVHNLVFRKSLRLVRFIFAVSLGAYLKTLREKQYKFFAAFLAFFTICLLGVPGTVADYKNLSRADGSIYSSLLHNTDLNANLWLKKNVPDDAVVQGRPDYGQKSNFTPTIVFGEKRAALGDFIRARNYQVGEEGPRKRSALLRKVIFGNGSIEETIRAIEQLNITHIYVGPEERAYYGPTANKFANSSNLFKPIYDRDGVTIFEVQRTAIESPTAQ